MNLLSHLSRKFFAVAIAALCLFSCARQGAPTGGPKDTDPPKVDTLLSTRNFSTRFSGRRIELVFDEWVALSDVGTQIVVSPTLSKRPEVTLKGKKVIFQLAEGDTLRPNTTYTINFGTAVKDFHENNPAKDLRFVFSTGDYLDSLEVRGIVADAFSGEPVENVSVMLYENTGDSVVRKERPYYFARTDKNGQFSIQNVRPGTFKAAGIEDASGDLKWDGQNERIGFPDSLLLLNDSAKFFLNLKIFKSQSKFRLFDSKTVRYGLVKLTFTATPDSVLLRTETPGLRYLAEKNQDTLLVWYDMPEPAAWQLFVGNDTVKVRDLPREDFLKNHKLVLADEAAASSNKRSRPRAEGTPAPKVVKTVNQSHVKPALLPFNTPIASVDTSQWLFVLDSVRVAGFSAKPDSAALRSVKVEFAWKPSKTYNLTLLPGAVTDFYGVANADTLYRNFNVLSEKQLGGLSLTIQSLRPGSRYVLQLLNGTVLEEERVFDAEMVEKKLTFTNLPAASYTAQLIEDWNRNGRWDTGDYFARRQPEPVFSKKLDPLRANWEVEAIMQAGAEQQKKRGG